MCEIVPLGLAYGIDPIHLGIIFLANMELGVGINSFLASYQFGKPVLQVSRAGIPMQCMLVIGVLWITYLPPLTTFLPRLWGGEGGGRSAWARRLFAGAQGQDRCR